MQTIKERIGNNKAELIGYIHEDLSDVVNTYTSRPAMIICPGGAYKELSKRTQDPVAVTFFAAGYQVFILRYSIGVEAIKTSEPEAELAEAVRYIKRNSEKLNIEKDKIAVLGCSAGGHLAASLACHWNRYGEESKPDSAVLCYPVITTDESFCNKMSVDHLCHGDKKRIEYFCLEKQVTCDTIPCFVWHTTEDKPVPMKNSISFISALADNNIPFEYHLFQKGPHGLSTGRLEAGREAQNVQPWTELCIAWLNERWNFKL